MDIELKRAYDPADPADGYRVFVDRLWPRGLSHESFHYDLWAKEIAPSDELRHWFHADPEKRAADFERRYEAELCSNPELPRVAAELKKHPKVTLLYASRDRLENNAVVLRRVLEN